MTKRSLLSLFAALTVLVSTSCDSAPAISGPDTSRSSSFDFRWAQPVSTLITTQGETTTATVVAVIGRNGGKIQNGSHVLIVPSKAVLTDTEFTFTTVGGNYVQVDLSAKTLTSGRGITIFNQPLTLRLSYAGANVADPSKLLIAYLADDSVDGRKERLSSFVSTSTQTVTSYLSHFSKYVIGTD